MNSSVFNEIDINAGAELLTVTEWLPTIINPVRTIPRSGGTSSTMGSVVSKGPLVRPVPDPWRSTSSRTGADPARGTAIRDPPGLVSSPPILQYRAPPPLPSNAGFSLLAVPDPRRGTSTPLYGPQKPFVIPQFLSWQPVYVQAKRPVLRAPGTDQVKDVWRFPEAVSADKWLAPIAQPSRPVVRTPGTTFATSPAELIYADKWQPTIVQPGRAAVYARGTDFVLLRELITADKWMPTWTQPARNIIGAKGSDLVMPIFDTALPSTTQGRLTLTSGDPIESSASGSTLYFTPYFGTYISLYNGSTAWNLVKFSETSISVPVGTGVYDVFAYNNNGTMALEPLAWTNSTTRATALVLQDGVYVKSGATTRKYLGTIYSSSGTCSDVLTARYVWNYYNRLQKKCLKATGNISWTYTTSNVWRALDNDSTNSFAVVVGVSESIIEAWSSVNVQPSDGNNSGAIGIGYDSTSTNSGDLLGISGFVAAFRTNTWAKLSHLTDIGLHIYYAIEIVVNVGGSILMNFNGNTGAYEGCGIGGTFYC